MSYADTEALKLTKIKQFTQNWTADVSLLWSEFIVSLFYFMHSTCRWTGWTLVVTIGHDDSTINIVFPLFIIIIIIIIILIS